MAGRGIRLGSAGVFFDTATQSQLHPNGDPVRLPFMTKLVSVPCAAVVAFLFASCAADRRAEMPEDQATKVRQHRIMPSEDLEETGQTKEGSPLPPTSEGSWKF